MGKTRDLFKKTKGTFHAKMGSIKGRNGMDLTPPAKERKDMNINNFTFTAGGDSLGRNIFSLS